MTKEEIIEAISEDKLMPFIQPDNLANIVNFVIKNYMHSLPSNLDEAAIQAAQIDMCERQIMEDSNEHRMLYSSIFRRGFKAGVEWMAGQFQQEQPDNEDIDKVAQELYEHLYELKRRNNLPTNLFDKQEIIHLWKAGIEYGRNHPKQKQDQPIGNVVEEVEKYFGDDWKNCPLLVQRELINFARTFVAKGYILAKGL